MPESIIFMCGKMPLLYHIRVKSQQHAYTGPRVDASPVSFAFGRPLDGGAAHAAIAALKGSAISGTLSSEGASRRNVSAVSPSWVMGFR